MKKIIAVMVAFMFAAVLFNINVSATDVNGGISSGGGGSSGNRTDFGNVLEVYTNNLGELVNGNITIDEFLTTSGQIIDESEDEFANHMGYGYINSIHENFVNGFWDNVADSESYIRDVLNPYETTDRVPDVDLQGHGALVKRIIRKNGLLQEQVYCSYIVLKNNNKTAWCYGDGFYYYYKSDGTLSSVTQIYDNGNNISSNLGGLTFPENSYCRIEVYGDIRLEDGTPAGDDVTNNDDINYSDINKYDFSNASDKELEELLNELNETLKRQQPDLSTMEGLLESIYYRLGKLDSDNDNALLSDINTAIIALSNSNDENAAQIIVALGEIKDEIKNMNGDINDNLEDLENNFDKIADFEIPDELLNVDFDNLSDAVKDKIDDIVELITTLVAKGVPMAAINGGLMFYQDIIFNSHEPQDITFDLSFNGEQYNFTILSTSFFGSEGAQALQIIKNFVAIVLGYAWILAMRKKAASMMN